jgi:uncharacterized short protein YbdD (DUF466 family)
VAGSALGRPPQVPWLGAAALRALRAAARVARAVIGAPDYDRYLAHMREHHPGRVPLSREEFACRQLEARYNSPGSRCC